MKNSWNPQDIHVSSYVIMWGHVVFSSLVYLTCFQQMLSLSQQKKNWALSIVQLGIECCRTGHLHESLSGTEHTCSTAVYLHKSHSSIFCWKTSTIQYQWWVPLIVGRDALGTLGGNSVPAPDHLYVCQHYFGINKVLPTSCGMRHSLLALSVLTTCNKLIAMNYMEKQGLTEQGHSRNSFSIFFPFCFTWFWYCLMVVY